MQNAWAERLGRCLAQITVRADRARKSVPSEYWSRAATPQIFARGKECVALRSSATPRQLTGPAVLPFPRAPAVVVIVEAAARPSV